MANPSLVKVGVDDPIILENFSRIETFMKEDLIYRGRFKFFEFEVPAALSNFPVAHRLNFVPVDVIMLSVRNSDGSTVTWHYDDFTSTYIYVTTSGPCTVRAFIGRYGENP